MSLQRMKPTWKRRTILIVGIPVFAVIVIVWGAALGISEFAVDTVKDWRESW